MIGNTSEQFLEMLFPPIARAVTVCVRCCRRKLNRKYVVVEGIYSNFGDLAPLDRIFELKEKYKYRLIVDESLSLGVLGETGRGACEHFGILGRVEIVAASMGNSLASIGGFCCGNREICDHQRLSGLSPLWVPSHPQVSILCFTVILMRFTSTFPSSCHYAGSGYCFSASLPPYLATAALGALHIMASDGQSQIERVQSNAAALRSQLSHSLQGMLARQGQMLVTTLDHALCSTQASVTHPADLQANAFELQDFGSGEVKRTLCLLSSC